MQCKRVRPFILSSNGNDASKEVSDGPVLLSPCMHVCPLPRPPSGLRFRPRPSSPSTVRRASGSGQGRVGPHRPLPIPPPTACPVHYESTGQAHTPSHSHSAIPTVRLSPPNLPRARANLIVQATTAHRRPDPDATRRDEKTTAPRGPTAGRRVRSGWPPRHPTVVKWSHQFTLVCLPPWIGKPEMDFLWEWKPKLSPHPIFCLKVQTSKLFFFPSLKVQVQVQVSIEKHIDTINKTRWKIITSSKGLAEIVDHERDIRRGKEARKWSRKVMWAAPCRPLLICSAGPNPQPPPKLIPSQSRNNYYVYKRDS